ncbi:putative transposase [Lactiplantibacillus plantarum]|nr:putative transposase [Lactiplantibacillus plantarum]MCG0851582.1 putative transposase [Lactiplantibacillus plantarum]MCG0906280.1 putative transposase [Lactiplantibacillus plantarum]MCG0909462.1 putative transposase [Lactiplantibacillus plantarum]
MVDCKINPNAVRINFTIYQYPTALRDQNNNFLISD